MRQHHEINNKYKKKKEDDERGKRKEERRNNKKSFGHGYFLLEMCQLIVKLLFLVLVHFVCLERVMYVCRITFSTE
jgi:hypothetical protein